MTHTPEQIKFMLDDMKKNNYHVYKLLTELIMKVDSLEKDLFFSTIHRNRFKDVLVPPTPPPTRVITENGKVTYNEKPVLREPPEGPPCREFHSFWHTETKESKRKTREWKERQKKNGY